MMLQGIRKMSAHLKAGLCSVIPVFLFIWLNLHCQGFTVTSDHQLLKTQQVLSCGSRLAVRDAS